MEKVSYLEYEVEKDEVKKLEIEDESARKEISSMKAKLDGLQEDVENCDICGIATGNTVNITDSAEAPFEELTLYGESKQEQTTGAQLLDLKANTDTATTNGMGISVESGCILTVNGTSSKAWSNLTEFKEIDIPSGKYTFSVDAVPSGLNGIGIKFRKSIEDSTNATHVITGSKKSITLDYSNDFKLVQIYADGCDSSKTYNFTIKVMLNAGETALPFEPYTGGKASPNPDYPQEIESKVVNQVVVHGKNELDCSGLTEQTITGVKFTPVIENGLLKYVIANGTNTASTVSQYVLKQALSLNDNEQHTLNGCPSGGSGTTFKLDCYYTGSNSFDDIGKGVTFTARKGENLKFRIVVFPGATLDNVKFYPMLRRASITDSTYEPYQSQTVNLSAPIKLNGIGDVRDYIDTERGVVVRKFRGKHILKSDMERFTQATNGNYICTYVLDGAQAFGKCICTHFLGIDTADRIKLAHLFRCYSEADKRVYFRDTVDGTLFSNATNTLAVFENNDVYLLYELEKPEEIALPQADINAIKALHSYNPNTIIQNNADAEMKVQYFRNTENGAVTGSLREDVNNLNKKSAEALVHDDVVDDLSSDDTDLPLSANKGRALNEKIDNIFSDIDEDSFMLNSNEFSGPIVDKELGTFTADKEGIYHFYGSMRIYGTSSEYQSGQIYLEIEYDSPSMYRIIKTGCKLCEGNAGSDYPNELELIPLDTTLYLKEDEKVLFTLKTQTPYEDDLYIEDDVHVFCRYKSAE